MTPLPSKDWYTSMTVWGAIIAMLAPIVVVVFHYSLSPELQSAIAGALAGIGGLVAVIGRMRATTVIQAQPPKEKLTTK